jgi:hypothetical protein
MMYNMLKSLWGQTTHRFNVSETILLAIVPTSQQMLKVYHLCSQWALPFEWGGRRLMRPKKKWAFFAIQGKSRQEEELY